jgi:hypothetical protein
MRDHILIIDTRGRWTVEQRVNIEPRPRLLRDRVEHAARVFMDGQKPRRWWRRYHGPVGAFWVGLDEGNLRIGGRLSHVEQATALGRFLP